MLKRINFIVVKISGEDENYPAAALNFQSPIVKGWQSPKLCSYPQIIVIRLERRTRICKLQLLSHEYLISRNVEVFAGDVPQGIAEIPQNIVWEKQGNFTFSENFQSNFTARELKSALMDVVAKFLKIILDQNHINRLNLCNQVGIVGINVIGESILESGSKKIKHMTDEDISHMRIENISPLDDLSFAMYVDPEVGHILRALQVKKQQAVLNDQFVYAKKLKYAMILLRKLGEKLAKLEIEKQIAIDEEDYDKAHVKKEEIDDNRMKEYERLHLAELMELSGNPDKGNEGMYAQSIKEENVPAEVKLPIISNYFSFDDMIVPTLKKNGKRQPSLYVSDTSKNADSYGVMTAKDKRLATLPIEVFGLPLVQKVYSKSPSQREESLIEILDYLKKYQKKGKYIPEVIVKATSFLIIKSLKDKVHSVYIMILTILKYCFETFIPQHNVSKFDSSQLAEKTTPDIVNRLGDMAPRTKNASIQYIMSIASYPEILNLQVISQYCLNPVQHDLNTRLVQAKCEVVEMLVKKYPPWNKEILSLSQVMLFLVDALKHPSAKVKHVAERTIIYIYRYQKPVVRKYIPLSSKESKKNIMYKRILRTFDNLDKQKKITRKPLHNKFLPKEDVNATNTNFMEENEKTDTRNKICIFCEQHNDDFTQEGLDIHYDKYCPMLLHCSNCKQIVEISGITDHLLEECDFKNQYRQCPICLEAIPLLNYEDHTTIRSCTMAKGNGEENHCPLCHNNIASGEEGWRNHLMSMEGCPYNKRRKRTQKKKSELFKKTAQESRNELH